MAPCENKLCDALVLVDLNQKVIVNENNDKSVVSA